MVKPPCCEKPSVKSGVWTAEEDAKILAFVSKHGSDNWTSVPKKAGLKRCGKSCRVRWTNYLRPDLKHDRFTPQEEDLILKLHAAIGSRWSIIAQQLPGRTDEEVKNLWNARLKKKLSEMGIDPVTHKPFSKLLADYGNIGGIHKPTTTTRIGSLTKDLKSKKNTLFLFKQQPPLPIIPINNNHMSSSLSTSSSLDASLSLPSFTWNDFLLLEDVFPPSSASADGYNNINTNIINDDADDENKQEVITMNTSTTTTTDESSHISFVEAMLHQENDIFLNFPHLLEEPSNY